jgi:hypothetical protein
VIVVQVTGVEAVAERLLAIPERVRLGLPTRLARIGEALVAAARASAPARSGALRRSIVASTKEADDGLSLTVGSDALHARAIEYGFRGAVGVRAHLRRVRQVFGRSLRGGAVSAQVRAHVRRMDVPERAFLRPALSSVTLQALEAIAAGVGEALDR